MRYITPFLLPAFIVCLIVRCANPSAETNEKAPEAPISNVKTETAPTFEIPENIKLPKGMIYIPGGTLKMGGNNDQADQDEFPKHDVVLNPFFMDKTEVTNRQFAQFVAATQYKTVAERAINWEEMAAQLPADAVKPPDSLLQPGSLVFKPTTRPVQLGNPAQWWQWTIGADWQHPEGPGSNIIGREEHPVVHIAWEDAQAYAEWAGKRLPTEAEWEWAARGGKENMVYPWGNANVADNPELANFWQGIFPYDNKLDDGYYTTAPVGSFPPNPFGLFDMAGNVWEWCSDWYRYDFYKTANSKVNLQENPSGPASSFDPAEPTVPKKVMRGGSFLCNDAYCSGYRVARRMKSSPDSGFNHTGFRCVKDVD